MTHQINDDTLMALADGELDEATARRVHEAIRVDPDLAERYAIFAETRALLEADTRSRDESVPPVLVAAVRAAAARSQSAAPSMAASAALRRAPAWRPLALAASLALVVGGLAGAGIERWRLASPAPAALALADTPGARAALTEAFARWPSGRTGPFVDAGSGRTGRIALIATHRLEDGSICRHAEIAGERIEAGVDTVVACRSPEGWSRRALISRPTGETYVPASGGIDPVSAILDSLGTHDPLTGAAEAAAIGGR
jgi:hypothetical protein